VRMTTMIDFDTRMRELREDYTYRVNEFIAEGREDLAYRLAEEFEAEAIALLRGSPTR
jgi:hypothetical protein